MKSNCTASYYGFPNVHVVVFDNDIEILTNRIRESVDHRRKKRSAATGAGHPLINDVMVPLGNSNASGYVEVLQIEFKIAGKSVRKFKT